MCTGKCSTVGRAGLTFLLPCDQCIVSGSVSLCLGLGLGLSLCLGLCLCLWVWVCVCVCVFVCVLQCSFHRLHSAMQHPWLDECSSKTVAGESRDWSMACRMSTFWHVSMLTDGWARPLAWVCSSADCTARRLKTRDKCCTPPLTHWPRWVTAMFRHFGQATKIRTVPSS